MYFFSRLLLATSTAFFAQEHREKRVVNNTEKENPVSHCSAFSPLFHTFSQRYSRPNIIVERAKKKVLLKHPIKSLQLLRVHLEEQSSACAITSPGTGSTGMVGARSWEEAGLGSSNSVRLLEKERQIATVAFPFRLLLFLKSI